MLLMIAAIILVLWLLGVVVFPVAGALVHVLLLVALIVIIGYFLGLGRDQQTVQCSEPRRSGGSISLGVVPRSAPTVAPGACT